MSPSLLLLLSVARSSASPPPPPVPVVAVVPAGGIGAGSEIALRAALDAAGWADADVVPADVFAERLDIVGVTRRSGDEDCGGPVELAAWRAGIDAARERLQVLELADALAGFVARELEAVCLAEAPANADLLRVELGVASAHHYLALAAGEDAPRRAFHDGESAAALERAVAIGHGLAIPADTDPEIARGWSAAEAAGARSAVEVAGPGAVSGVRVDGRPVSEGGVDLPVGPHLVQATDGARVRAAAIVEVHPGRDVLVWVAPGGVAPDAGTLTRAVHALGGGPPEPAGEAVLVAAGRLAGEGAPVVFAALDADRVGLWAPAETRLVRLDADVAVARATRVGGRWSLDVGAGAAGSTLGGGALEGLGGVGPAIQGGVAARLAGPWSLAGTLRPSAVARRLAPWEGGGVLFRATLPVCGGARWGRAIGPWIVEAGADLCAHLFGPFEPFRLGFLGAAVLGVSRPVAGREVHAEAWGGPGTGYGAAGASVGLRWRP